MRQHKQAMRRYEWLTSKLARHGRDCQGWLTTTMKTKLVMSNGLPPKLHAQRWRRWWTVGGLAAVEARQCLYGDRRHFDWCCRGEVHLPRPRAGWQPLDAGAGADILVGVFAVDGVAAAAVGELKRLKGPRRWQWRGGRGCLHPCHQIAAQDAAAAAKRRPKGQVIRGEHPVWQLPTKMHLGQRAGRGSS